MADAAVILLAIWSLLNCFFGYRLFKSLTVFYSIAFITLLATMLAMPFGPVILLIAMIIGILIGWFLRELLYYVIVFVMGFMIVLIVASMAGSLLGSFIPSFSEDTRLILSLIIGVLGGAIGVKHHRTVFITSSAVLGGIGLGVCGDFFMNHSGALLQTYNTTGGFSLLKGLFDNGNFLMLLIIAALAAFGLVVQYRAEYGRRERKGKPSKTDG